MLFERKETAMARPMWVVKLIMKGFPHKDIGAAMTRLPLVGRVAEKLFFEGDDIMFLPRTVRVGETLEEPRSVAAPWLVIDHFIEQAGFLWVMNTCICRASMKCDHYPVELGCLFMGEAARDIDPRLGRPVSRTEAREHLRKCREAGLFHLLGRNKVDAVWLDVKPADRLMTVCNCCTCCCLWTFLPKLSERIASSVYRLDGLDVEVTGACLGCGVCLEAGCLAGAIELVDKQAVIGEECRGCGRCAQLCPEGAIEIRFDGDRALEAALGRLSTRLDVT